MRKLLLLSSLLFAYCFSFSQLPKLPPNTKVIYFGDSQTSFALGVNGNAVQYQNYGYVSWANALFTGAQIPKGGILAVPGETTSQMVSRLNAISAFGARIMVVLAGTNDPLYNITPETTKANLRSIYDAGLAAGMRVIAITILPRFGSSAYDAATEANRHAINAWIKSQNDILVLDVESDVNAPEHFEEGLHPSPRGAYMIGSRVAAELSKLIEQCLPGSLKASDLSVAANTNPLLTGTGGFANGASGTVATHWELAANGAGGATVAGQKETDAAGNEKQVISMTGMYNGDWRRVTFNNYAAAPIQLQAGDVIEGISEIEIAAPLTGVKAIYLRVSVSTSDYLTTLADGNSMFPTSDQPLHMPAGKYVLRTPPMTISPGAIGQLTTQIVVEFNNTSTPVPVSAMLKISNVGIRHLPLAAGPAATITPSGTHPLCLGETVLLKAGTANNYTYQWNVNGNAIPNSTASTLAVKDPGNYTVTVATPGCALTSAPTTVSMIACNPANQITTGNLPAVLCSGQEVQLPFTVSGTFAAGNVFTAQLSNANGDFSRAVSIGTLEGTTAGSIRVRIPAGLPTGTGYRVRVIANNPATTGSDNGSAISINLLPVVKTRNITVSLDEAGRASITPQQVNNGSTASCGIPQLSLNRTRFTCANIGTNTVILTVRDANGNTANGTAVVTVRDDRKPTITNVSATPTILWPANHKMVLVKLNYLVQDNCGTPTVSLSVKSNEPVNGRGDGNTSADWKVVNKNEVQVRAERSSSGTGRIYTITITATDATGNKGTHDVMVYVPHSMIKKTETQPADRSTAAEEMKLMKGLQLTVQPNPSASYFTLLATSDSDEPLSIRVFDAAGRLVETKSNITANGSLQIGHRYKAGRYIVEAVQGERMVTLQLIKTAQ